MTAVNHVNTIDEAKALAHHLLNPARPHVVVVVTTTSEGVRRYDAERIHDECEDAASVWVMPPGRIGMEFSHHLPDQMSVFGGAARVYPKGTAWLTNRYAAPLFFAFTDDEADYKVEHLIDRAVELSHLTTPAGSPAVAPARVLEHAPDEAPKLVAEIAAAAKNVKAPSPAALVSGVVRVETAPVVTVVAEPVSELPPAEDFELLDTAPTPPEVEEVVRLREDLEVERFRRTQEEHEHLAEVRELRKQLAQYALRQAPAHRTRPKPLADHLDELQARLNDTREALRIEREDGSEELRQARIENAELRKRLTEQADTHRNRMTKARKKTKADDTPQSANPWAPELFADTEEAVRYAIYQTWVQRIPAQDKASYPLPAYLIGADFADSLDRLDTGQQTKALRCVVDILTDLARDLPARRIHPLRSGTAADSVPRTRADGAVCFRANVETAVGNARRLHYWKRTDGVVELARVVEHEDLEP